MLATDLLNDSPPAAEERDHRVESAIAVLAWLKEAGHVREARGWYVDQVVPALRQALEA
jgi:hypothetical protein